MDQVRMFQVNFTSAAGDESDADPLPYPGQKVVGILDKSQAPRSTVDALVAAGFGVAQLEVFLGESGSQPAGEGTPSEGYDTVGRLWDLAAHASEGRDYAVDYEEALRAGHALVVVLTESDEQKQSAGDVLLRQGATAIRYFGNWTIETITG